jgi:hypothetical protein
MGSRQRRMERKLAGSSSPDIISRVPEENVAQSAIVLSDDAYVYRLTPAGEAYIATPEFKRFRKHMRALKSLALSMGIDAEDRPMFAMFLQVICGHDFDDPEPTLEELLEPTDVTESDVRDAIERLRKMGLLDEHSYTLGPRALACLESLTYE